MHGFASITSAFTAYSDKPWVLDSRIFTHTIGIRKTTLSFLNNIPLINIVDGTSSTFVEKELFMLHFLSLNNILFVPKFPVSLLSTEKITTQNCYRAIFDPSYCVSGFVDLDEDWFRS